METHNTREVEEWEKEFDKQFAKGFYNGDWVLFYCPTSDQKDEHPATEEDVKSFIHHQLQKARHDWLREEIGRLEGMKFKKTHPETNTIGHDREMFNTALQTIIDRYQAELDQDVSKWSQCNDCFDGQHDKCIGRKYGCECKHQADPLPTQVTE